jgi:hypothetical protein
LQFINTATRQDGRAIGHGLKSYTSNIQSVITTSPDGRHVVLVDTPGFDDTFKSDIDILEIIATWLVKG